MAKLTPLSKIYKLIEKSQNPLIFFDDDPDGLCSYLLIKKHFRKGHPVLVKSSPKLDATYIGKVNEYSPDLILVLDKPKLTQDFIDKANVPVIYIDHHPINDIKGVHYFNPLMKDEKDDRPVSYWCYKLTKDNLWIGTVGTAADYSLATIKQFHKKFPDLLKYRDKPSDVLYKTELGRLIRIFSFILQHPHYKALQYVNLMEKIESPYELLEASSDNAREILKIYEKVNKRYQALLERALPVQKSKVHVFVHSDSKLGFRADLSSELQYMFKDKLILVGKRTEDVIRMSLRYQNGDLNKLMQKAFEGLEGSGGGHMHACGGIIKSKDFDEFVRRLESYIK